MAHIHRSVCMKHLLFFFMLYSVGFGCRKSGKETSGETVENPLVARQNLPAAWQKMKATGTDFLALGNEPFWSLQIDFEKELRIWILSEDSLAVPMPEWKSENGIIRLQAHQIRVELLPDSCSDTMSGRQFDYSVSVSVKDENYHGCGLFLNLEMRNNL